MSGEVKRLPRLFPYFEERPRRLISAGNSRAVTVPTVWVSAFVPAELKALALREFLIYWPVSWDREPRAMLRELAITALEAWATIEKDEATRARIAEAWKVLKELEDQDPDAWGWDQDAEDGD